jgi:hypothetical protein
VTRNSRPSFRIAGYSSSAPAAVIASGTGRPSNWGEVGRVRPKFGVETPTTPPSVELPQPLSPGGARRSQDCCCFDRHWEEEERTKGYRHLGCGLVQLQEAGQSNKGPIGAQPFPVQLRVFLTGTMRARSRYGASA